MPTEVPLNSRVLFQAEIEAMGGAERSLLALSQWLWKQGKAHHLVTYVDHVGIASHVDYPLTVVQLNPQMSAVKKVAAMRRYFADRPEQPAPLMSGYQGAMHAALAGITESHCLMHDTPDLFEDEAGLSAKQRMRRWVSDQIVGYGLRSGGRTIVTSEHLRERSRILYGVEADIARMGGLTDASAFHVRPVEGTLRLLSVSRVEANKRIECLFVGLAALERDAQPLSSRVNWTLDLAGRGSQMEAMQQLAASLGLDERVRFLGYVSDAELEVLYDKAHLFLMPAVQGYGIPAIEALSRGLPVLLHRESGVSDILLTTPWATVIEGGEANMLPGLRKAIDAAIKGVALRSPLPSLPTEDGWAERVATLCSWV